MNRARTVATGVLILAAGLTWTASPAQASTADCASNRMCLWDDNGFTDTLKQLTAGDKDFHNLGGSNFNDKASSVYNKTSVAWVMYDDINWTDTSVCVKANSSATNLSSYSFNDKASSIHRLSNNTCPSGVNHIISGHH